MKSIFCIFVATIALFLASCEEKDFETEQSIRITNYTDFTIDTIKIWSMGDYIEYSNILPLTRTDFKTMIDMSNESYFSVYIDDTMISNEWVMPILERSEIVPTQISSPSPTGSYTFGVFSADTTISSIFIGLIEYSIE